MKKKRTIRGYFFAGLLIVVPAYITIYILRLIVGFLGSFTKSFPQWLKPETYFSFSFPGLEIAITIVGIFLARGDSYELPRQEPCKVLGEVDR